MLYINITVIIFPILIIASDTEIGTQLLVDSFFMNRNVLHEGFKVTGIIHNAISWDYSLNHLHSRRSYIANKAPNNLNIGIHSFEISSPVDSWASLCVL